jgi:hypothetical protein
LSRPSIRQYFGRFDEPLLGCGPAVRAGAAVAGLWLRNPGPPTNLANRVALPQQMRDAGGYPQGVRHRSSTGQFIDLLGPRSTALELVLPYTA